MRFFAAGFALVHLDDYDCAAYGCVLSTPKTATWLQKIQAAKVSLGHSVIKSHFRSNYSLWLVTAREVYSIELMFWLLRLCPEQRIHLQLRLEQCICQC